MLLRQPASYGSCEFGCLAIALFSTTIRWRLAPCSTSTEPMPASLLSLALEHGPVNRLTQARVVAAAAVHNEPQNLLEHLPWDGDLRHLEDDVAAVADDLRADLMSFSFRLVSDQRLIGSGVASVRKKLPKL